jgi:hypothetical protein
VEKEKEKERGREGGGEVGETERLRWGFLGWFNFVKKIPFAVLCGASAAVNGGTREREKVGQVGKVSYLLQSIMTTRVVWKLTGFVCL